MPSESRLLVRENASSGCVCGCLDLYQWGVAVRMPDAGCGMWVPAVRAVWEQTYVALWRALGSEEPPAIVWVV